jgi:hypothetical protein
MLESTIADVFARLGVAGSVSIVALLGLVSIAVWSSRARHAGAVVSRGLTTAQMLALSLVGLALAGLITIHTGRAHEVLVWMADVVPDVVVDAWRWVT